MSLFNFGKKSKSGYPETTYTFTQTENYKGFKRIKLTSYGYEPAQAGIKAVSKMDLTGKDISIIVVDKPSSPYAIVKVGKHHIGTIFKNSFSDFSKLKTGKVSAVRVEIRDGESFIFYKV